MKLSWYKVCISRTVHDGLSCTPLRHCLVCVCVCVCVCVGCTTLPTGSTSTRTPPASITTIVWLIHPSDWLPVQRGPGVSPLTGVVFSCSRSRSPSPRGIHADAYMARSQMSVAGVGRRRRSHKLCEGDRPTFPSTGSAHIGPNRGYPPPTRVTVFVHLLAYVLFF